jgi:hypothetical protein
MKKWKKNHIPPKFMAVIVGVGSFTEIIDGVYIIPYELIKN